MKRRLCIILSALMSITAGAFGFAACDEDDTKDTHVHEYGEWTVVTAATCTESGERRQYCICGETKTEEIYPLGHDLESVDGKDYDCTNDGWKKYHICKREGCGYTTKELIPARHDFNPDGYCIRCDKPQATYHHDEIDGDNVTFEALINPTITDLVVPSTVRIDGDICNVTVIGDRALQGKDIKSVVISEGITSIGDNVFENCKNLTKVEIPDSVVSIGMGVFDGCDNIKYNEKDNCCYLGSENNPYRILVKIKNTSITTFKIDESVEIVYYGLFSQCENLKSVTIGNNLNNSDSLFAGCAGLESVVFSDNLDAIGNYMFQGCESLKTLKIPESVTSIGTSAFAGSGLTEIEIPDNVTSIGENAFEGTALSSVIFSRNPAEIGENAFGNCENLEFVILPEGLTKISNYLFTGSANLKYVYIPSTVQEIGSFVFDYCGNGEKVKIYYDGTAEQWAEIAHSDSDYSEWGTVYYHSETRPSASGNYWRWDEDGTHPVPYQA